MSYFKAVLIVLSIVLLQSCAHNKTYNYADYKQSFNTGMSFYSQYELVYLATAENGKEKLIVTPFLADSNQYLPGKIVKLHLGLKIINPSEEKFVIWKDYQFTGIDSDEYLQTSKLVHMSQGLPEEFISIDLPYMTNIHSKVSFSIEVISEKGVLYKSSRALYKIKGVQTKLQGEYDYEKSVR